MTDRFEVHVAITGIGRSALGRRLGRADLDLTVEACRRAIADAGLDRADIDGLVSYPGAANPLIRPVTGPSTWEVQDALGLELAWYAGGVEVPAQLGAIVQAGLAIAGGLAHHVLVYRTVTEGSASGAGARRSSEVPVPVTEPNTWLTPFGVVSSANRVALYAQRHFHEFGTRREHLAAVAVNARRNAGHNPYAVYREPLTVDEHLAARLISSPLGLYDCDVPMDGSTAFVVSRRDRARDGATTPIRIDAAGTAVRGRPRWDQWEDFTTMASTDAAAHLWSRTTLRPADVDVAELYDGFSILVLFWLEALGFCGRGESGPFVDGGTRIALDGALPLNTDGGQLSAGRMHGFGLLYEACLQVRGAAGARQVAGAEVAVVATGGGPLASSLLLTPMR